VNLETGVRGTTEEQAVASSYRWVSDRKTDANGRARLRSLRAGASYRLRVKARPRDEAFPFASDRWAPADTLVRLRRAFVVEGVVRDGAGRPVEDAKLALWVGEKRELESTDEEGRFRFDKLEDGTFLLRAARTYQDLEGGPGPDARSVPAGTRDLVLTIDPGVPLVLRAPPPRIYRKVYVYAREGGALREVRDELEYVGDEPTFVRGLEPGQAYVVWVPADDDDPRYALAEVRDPAAGPVDLEFQKGATLRLREAPLPLRWVMAKSAAGLEMYGSTFAKNGVLAGMAPGVWTLEVEDGDHADWIATVTVGAADMDVPLRRR
jgi:hypothetical protein